MRIFCYVLSVFLTVLMGVAPSFAQGRLIRGKVVASDDRAPLPNVNIQLKGGQGGTVTDLNGDYQIAVPGGNVALVFSFVGYVTKEVPVGVSDTLNVSLEPDVRLLSEVVVLSLGIEQQKRSLGYSVQEVKSEEIVATRQQNLVNALQGQVAGVQITGAGGAPGMSSRILIRGIKSLDPSSDNQPLFVVDGVPIDNSTYEAEGTPRGMSNRVADLNMGDIESVNILKGAAATALYGVRAANGAVIINTKKGTAGRLRIAISNSTSLDDVNRYPAFQSEYGQGFSGVNSPANVFWPAWGPRISEEQQRNPDYRYYNNWKGAMRTGVSIDNSLSISGGSESATFYASFSNLTQEGIMPFSDWDRTSVRLSGSTKLAERFSVTGSMNYIRSGGNRVPHDRFMERLVYWAVTVDVQDYENADGTMKTYENTNPIYDAKYATYKDDVNRLIGNLTFDYNPASWLSLKYTLGTDYYSDERSDVTPGPLGVDGEVPLSATGFVAETRRLNRDLNSTLSLTLQKTFANDLAATVRVGNDVFDRQTNTLFSRGDEFIIPRFYNLSNTRNISSTQTLLQRRLVGVYGDIMLDYADVLFLNVTGRNDWSSTLPKENRSFFYPSVNVGWVFSDMLPMPEALSYGKLRASWAEVGKDAPPYSTAITYNSPAPFPLGGEVGYTRSNSLGTADLKPERTTSIELGADIRFLEDRIGLDVTLYKANSKDQILAVPVSYTTGFSTLITNAGEIENKGVEVMLRGVPVLRDRFRWEVSVNLSKNKNTVVDIREGIETIILGTQSGYVGSTATMMLMRGQPYGLITGTSYARYYPGGPPDGQFFLDSGRPLLIGANGFPVIDSRQLILGNIQPDWIGGVRNSLSYGNFNLSFLVDFRFGLEQYNQFNNFFSAFGLTEYTLDRNDTKVFQGVTADGRENTKPVWLGQGVGPDGVDYGAGYYRNTYRASTENSIEDASFIKLRNIGLSYDLGPSILRRLPLDGATLSVAANNIILWTPWTGFDPEAFSVGAGGNATGFSGLGHPGVRSIVFGVNIAL